MFSFSLLLLHSLRTALYFGFVKINRSGQFKGNKTSSGSEGRADIHLRDPWGITVDKDQVFVGDFKKDRV
jgi:hypothetical protein